MRSKSQENPEVKREGMTIDYRKDKRDKKRKKKVGVRG